MSLTAFSIRFRCGMFHWPLACGLWWCAFAVFVLWFLSLHLVWNEWKHFFQMSQLNGSMQIAVPFNYMKSVLLSFIHTKADLRTIRERERPKLKKLTKISAVIKYRLNCMWKTSIEHKFYGPMDYYKTPYNLWHCVTWKISSNCENKINDSKLLRCQQFTSRKRIVSVQNMKWIWIANVEKRKKWKENEKLRIHFESSHIVDKANQTKYTNDTHRNRMQLNEKFAQFTPGPPLRWEMWW